MDGVQVWARTLAQLMAKSKPQDTWELVPDENLAFGHVDSGGFQYRLRGLSRLQCSRCQWGWSSAHVHILFHVWWDEDSHLGLVKMRVWGQGCQACPRDARGHCQVSLLNVRLFLHKLVLFVLHNCYREGLSSDQCPEICFGDQCEACELGVCFFQKPPDPAWGPEVRSCGPSQDSLCGSGPVVHRARGRTPSCSTVPPAMPDVIRSPLSESNQFFSEDIDIVTVPFSLVRTRSDRGLLGPGRGARGPLIIDRGSIYLPASVTATSTGRGVLVNIKAPILHGKGRLLSSIKPFQVTGFIYKGHGSVSCPAGTHRQGPGSVPGSSGRPAGEDFLPVSYIIGLTEDGDGSLTFPSSLAHVIPGPGYPSDVNGSLTFPFVFTDGHWGQGGSGLIRVGPEPSPSSTCKGSLTIPLSVLSVIKRGGLHASGCCRSRRHRRPRAHREQGSCWGPYLDPYEEVWIWVCMAAFILWVIYLCTFSPDNSQQRL
nr:PREDICTED: receptor-transporting protein 5 [Rhinolophus sinicus]